MRLIFKRLCRLGQCLRRVPFRRQRLGAFLGRPVAGAGAFTFQRCDLACILGCLGLRLRQQAALFCKGFGSLFDVRAHCTHSGFAFRDLLCSRYLGFQFGLLLRQLQLLILGLLFAQSSALFRVFRCKLLHSLRSGFGEWLYGSQRLRGCVEAFAQRLSPLLCCGYRGDFLVFAAHLRLRFPQCFFRLGKRLGSGSVFRPLACGRLLRLEVAGRLFGFGLGVQDLLSQCDNAVTGRFTLFHLPPRFLFALFRINAVCAQLAPERIVSSAALPGGGERLVELLLHKCLYLLEARIFGQRLQGVD